MIKEKKRREVNTLGHFLQKGTVQETFITDKDLRRVTALAVYYEVKVRVENILVISGLTQAKQLTEKQTKITIISRGKE